MRYFYNLGFFPTVTALGPRIQTKRKLWTVLVYALLSLGIFARQIVDFPKIRLVADHLDWKILCASLIVGLAVFPPTMRWLNRRRGSPTFEHFLLPFSLGFFLDLTMKLIVNPFFK